MFQQILENPALSGLIGALILAAVSEVLPFLPTKAQGIIHGIIEAIRRAPKPEPTQAPEDPKA